MRRPEVVGAESRINRHFFEKRENERKEGVFEEAYAKALGDLKDEAINPENFTIYDPKEIEGDLEYVRQMEELFKSKDTQSTEYMRKLAIILEALILNQTEQNDWLGPNVRTVKTSSFDDIKNGTDIVVEITGEDGVEPVRLALDVTCSGGAIKDKLGRLRSQTDTGKLTKLKYFESADGAQEPLIQIPRVVVGVQREKILELADQWLNRKNKELARSDVQFILIDEIRLQLRTLAEYARKREDSETADRYEKPLGLIQSIRDLPSKQAIARSYDLRGHLSTDSVYNHIVVAASMI